MVISLVHPLVQVYTIPITVELAYAGHICNFKQHVSQFLSSLPMRPADVPFVLVRPRRAIGQPEQKLRAPFRADVVKLRAAFEWLQQHNPYYRAVTWDQDSAAAWEDDDLQFPERQMDLPDDQLLGQTQDFKAQTEAEKIHGIKETQGAHGNHTGTTRIST